MITVSNLFKKFHTEHESVRAARDVSFEVAEGEFYTLLGPSGCGKSTTLRCIAGLEQPDIGQIQLGKTVVFSSEKHLNLVPEKRGIGMVFQSYAIWPHMTVFENVAFPLQEGSKRISRAQIRERVTKALDIVQLENLERRDATQLSGGQQQRLALARALVGEPEVLLLDEPLSNLDAKLRAEMRVELRELQRRLGITTLYVTHDQTEALSMSNTIAVMRDGKIIQIGSPDEIYMHPKSGFVASFMGSTNLIPGKLRVDQETFSVETRIGVFQCNSSKGLDRGGNVLLAIQPVNVVLHKERGENANVVPGTVELALFSGDYWDCDVRVGTDLVIHLKPLPSSNPTLGQQVFLELPAQNCTAVEFEKSEKD